MGRVGERRPHLAERGPAGDQVIEVDGAGGGEGFFVRDAADVMELVGDDGVGAVPDPAT